MTKFAEKLKEVREEKGLSQEQLGKELHFTQTCIAKWESGARTPNLDNLVLIAKFFEVTTDYLLGLEHKQEIDLSGLSQEEIDALLNLIKAMKRN